MTRRPATDRLAMCAGKAGFGFAEATSRARQARRRRDDDEPRIAYHCPACGRWHLGTRSVVDKGRKG